MKPEKSLEERIKALQQEFESDPTNHSLPPTEHKKVGGNTWANHAARALEQREDEEDRRWHPNDN